MAGISAKDVKALREKTGAGMMDCKRALTDAAGDLSVASDLLRERGLAKAGKRAGRATSEGSVAVALSDRAAAMIELGCETDFVAKTDAFQALAQSIAEAVVADPSADSVKAVEALTLGDGSVGERITATSSKVGENVLLKRVARIDLEAGVPGGYVHAGGKLGVIVGLGTSGQGEALRALTRDLSMHVAAVDPTPLAVERGSIAAAVVDKERELLKREALQTGKPEAVIERIVEGRLNKFFAENCLLEQAFVKDPDRSVGDLVKGVSDEVGAEVDVCGFVRFKLGEASAA